jgi:uncharacterized membrane protein YjfL (UPF0719 family)
MLALIVSCVLGVFGWKQWAGGLLLVEPLSRRTYAEVIGLMLLPPMAAGVMLVVLWNWSSHDVRDSGIYIFFYLAMWLGWTGIWNLVMPYLGLSCRDDAFERNNSAAGLALGGGLLGVTFVFAGSNIGEGPGWWVVVFCAGLGTAVLLLLWLLDNQITGVIEAITVDRDIAAGWRAAGFFIGSGLILGRALAGDWHSAGATVHDFVAKGAPVLSLSAAATVMDGFLRPTPKRPEPRHLLFGFIPFLLLVAAGIGDFIIQGPW